MSETDGARIATQEEVDDSRNATLKTVVTLIAVVGIPLAAFGIGYKVGKKKGGY